MQRVRVNRLFVLSIQFSFNSFQPLLKLFQLGMRFLQVIFENNSQIRIT